MQIKKLFIKSSITVADDKKEITKVVGTPFEPLTRMWCRHEAECLLKLTELGYPNAPKLISSTLNSLTMEKIEGTSLHREFIDEQMFFRIMGVVRELHALGFAHGNLRPNNIFIRDRNEPVLIDFETSCQMHNPLFFLVKFIDRMRLHLLWQSRVMQSSQDLVRTLFPRHVTLAMFIITPVNNLLGFFYSVKKRLRRSHKVSARKRDASR